MYADHFKPGIVDGDQYDLSGKSSKAYVVNRDARLFLEWRCEYQLTLAVISKYTLITIDILDKLERGELIGTHYWWLKFRQLAESKLEEVYGPKDNMRCSESEEQTSFDFKEGKGSK